MDVYTTTERQQIGARPVTACRHGRRLGTSCTYCRESVDSSVERREARQVRDWVIWSDDERGWWSNRQGWVGRLVHAERFTGAERRRFNLPIGGVWVQLLELPFQEAAA